MQSASSFPQDPNVAAVLAFATVVRKLFSEQQTTSSGTTWQNLMPKFDRPELASAMVSSGNILEASHPAHQIFKEFACWQQILVRLLTLQSETTPLLPILPSHLSGNELHIRNCIRNFEGQEAWRSFSAQHGDAMRRLLSNHRELQSTFNSIASLSTLPSQTGSIDDDQAVVKPVLGFLAKLLVNPTVPVVPPFDVLSSARSFSLEDLLPSRCCATVAALCSSVKNTIATHFQHNWAFWGWGLITFGMLGGFLAGLICGNIKAFQNAEKEAGLNISSTDQVLRLLKAGVVIDDCGNTNMTAYRIQEAKCDFSMEFVIYLIVTLVVSLPLLGLAVCINRPSRRDHASLAAREAAAQIQDV